MYRIIILLVLYLPLLRAQYAETPFPRDFPLVEVVTPQEGGHGVYLLSNYAMTPQPISSYLMQLTSSGYPENYKKLDSAATDFKIQPDGNYSYFNVKAGKFYILNEKWNVIDSVAATGGLVTNDHELKVLPNGHKLIIADEERILDLSHIVPGGSDTAHVIGNHIQEYDEFGELIFDWNSFDHFSVTDAAPDILLIGKVVDFVHTNSIELDTDGNYIISSRNINEITKIDRTTGRIIWRWGGAHNQFTFKNDIYGFSHQHDVRRLKNGNILMFDNGNNRSPQFSRVVEYKLDESAKKATLVWEYRHSPDIYSTAMGSAQRMPNGNTVIGWGFNVSYALNTYLIAATEVTYDKQEVFEIKLPMFHYSYRVFHHDPVSVSNDTTHLDDTPTAIKEKLRTQSFGITVYPNPVQGTANIAVATATPEATSLKMYDVLGREIKDLSDRLSSGTTTIQISSSQLAAGVYYVRLQSGKETATQKVIIVN